MSYVSLDYQFSDSIARITINRPQFFNAIDLDTAKEFCDIAGRCSADPGVRAVILTGAGNKAFCAGGDVASFAKDPETIDVLLRDITLYLHKAMSLLAGLDAPVIAAVNGVAAGAGLSLVACCDLAVASDKAHFRSAYSALGFTPDGGFTYLLPRLIGHRRTTELYLTNRLLSAQEALEWGLINRVVAPADLAEQVDQLAHQLAVGPTVAYGAFKKMMTTSFVSTFEAQMEQESKQISACSITPDGGEGVKAFVEKRKAIFRG